MSAAPSAYNQLALGLQAAQEVPDPIRLPVSGVLPAYLARSTLYRNGPGRFSAPHSSGPPRTVRHWFDGFAMVHAFAIDALDNTVTYRSSFTCKPTLRAIKNCDSRSYTPYDFGRADPCKSLLGKMFQMWTKQPVDPETGRPAPAQANVTIQTVPGKGEVVARTDTNANVLLDPETLEVEQFFSFKDMNEALEGPFSAAHGHYDDETREFFNFNFNLTGPGKTKYSVFRIRDEGKTEVLATFEELPCYLHSFATTENYVVICVWPQRLDPLRLVFNKSMMDGMRLDRKARTKFYVVSRKGGGVVATYEAEPFFCFHNINAFEQGGGIHIDLCQYEDDSVLDQFQLDYMRTQTEFVDTSLVRYSLESVPEGIARAPQTSAPAVKKILSDSTLELPRIHPGRLRKDYRFVYGVSTSQGGLFDTVAKVDVKTGERWIWAPQNGVVGEPVFVPRPGGSEEDEGCLLVVVLDSDARKSAMVVIDAESMSEVARATVPQIVPLGFHGKVRSIGPTAH